MTKFVYRGKDKKFAQRFDAGGQVGGLYQIQPVNSSGGQAQQSSTAATNAGTFSSPATPARPAKPATAPTTPPTPSPTAPSGGFVSGSGSDLGNLNQLGRPGGL